MLCSRAIGCFEAGIKTQKLSLFDNRVLATPVGKPLSFMLAEIVELNP